MGNLLWRSALSFVLLTGFDSTAGGRPPREFFISMWGGLRFDRPAEPQVARMAEAGFNWVNLPTGYPFGHVTPEQNRAALDACALYGLKYLLPDKRLMALPPDDPGFRMNLDAVVREFGKHPALGGYFVCDEPHARLFPQIAAVVKYLRQRDPARLAYVNLFPNYASAEQLGHARYDQHVREFVRMVRPELLSYDHYTMMIGDPLQPEHTESYFRNMELVRTVGREHRIPTCFILLSTAHGPYRNPTEADLRWQVNTALAHGYRGIMYFTYLAIGTNNTGIVGAEGEPEVQFPVVRQINRQLQRLGPTLMRLTSVGVFHSADPPPGSRLPDESCFVRVQAGQPVLIGLFRHENGSRWVMLVNRHLRLGTEIRLTRTDGKTRFERWDETCSRLVRSPDRAGEFYCVLGPGEMTLLRLP